MASFGSCHRSRMDEDDRALIDEALPERASVRQLVEMGVLESQGNLNRMRFSEVKLRARRF